MVGPSARAHRTLHSPGTVQMIASRQNNNHASRLRNKLAQQLARVASGSADRKNDRRRSQIRRGSLRAESLETRQLMAVDTVWLSNKTLVARTDDVSTTVELRR